MSSVPESQNSVIGCIADEIIREHEAEEELQNNEGIDTINTERDDEIVISGLLNTTLPAEPPSWHQKEDDWCFITANHRDSILGDSEKVLLNFLDDYSADKKKIIWLNNNINSDDGQRFLTNFNMAEMFQLEKRLSCNSNDVIECNIFYYVFHAQSKSKIHLMCFGCFMECGFHFLQSMPNIAIMKFHVHDKYHVHCLRCGYNCQCPTYWCGEKFYRKQEAIAFTTPHNQ